MTFDFAYVTLWDKIKCFNLNFNVSKNIVFKIVLCIIPVVRRLSYKRLSYKKNMQTDCLLQMGD